MSSSTKRAKISKQEEVEDSTHLSDDEELALHLLRT